jgi:hypothetical protein
MPELENPAENPCFGCGPHHSRGLRLKFESVLGGDGVPEVRTTFVPKADEIGWPTLFHHGLHFLVLYEASYWTALTLRGKLWVSTGASTYSTDRLPRVGVAHLARARIVRADPESLSIRATTATVGGKPCGSLDTSWRPASRAAIERARIPIPDYLLSEIAPEE